MTTTMKRQTTTIWTLASEVRWTAVQMQQEEEEEEQKQKEQTSR